MLITVKTTIGFKMPEEYELHQIFAETNDLSKWAKHEFTTGTYYTNTDTYYSREEKDGSD